MKFVYGCLVNDRQILENNLLLPGRINAQLFIEENVERASIGLNKLSKRMLETGADVLIFMHQDCILPPNWEANCQKKLEELKDWSLAGVWGIDDTDTFVGHVWDIRIWPYMMKSDNLPRPARCLDEICLIMKANACVKFDTNMTGFDLYGSYACLETVKNGGKAWIIEVPMMHNTRRQFRFEVSEEFKTNYEYLEKKFYPLEVRSTVYEKVE